MAKKQNKKSSFLQKKLNPFIGLVLSYGIAIIAVAYWIIALVVYPAYQLIFEYRGIAYPVQVYVDRCVEITNRRGSVYYCHVYVSSNGKYYYPEVGRATYQSFTPGSLQTMYQFRDTALSEDGLVPGTIIIRLAGGLGVPAVLGLFYGASHLVGKKIRKSKKAKRRKVWKPE